MTQAYTSPVDISGELELDPIANPYPDYHQLRAADPVHWNEAMKRRDLTRYTDVMDLRFAGSRRCSQLDPYIVVAQLFQALRNIYPI
jgi:hypothetical protein